MKSLSYLSTRGKLAFGISFLSLVTLFAACKKSDPVEIPVGELDVKVVNTVSGSASQDFLVNNTVKATAVAYGSSSQYFKMTSGVSTVGFYDTGTTTTANAGGQLDLPIGAKATLYYFKQPNGTLGAFVLNDVAATPASGKAKVRFLHLNNFLGTTANIAISVSGGSTTLVPSAVYGETTNYFDVDAGTKFDFTGTGIVTGSSYDPGIVAGKVYTIWIDGTAATNLNGHVVVHE